MITGANRGIGKGFVQHYLASDFRVIATSRGPNEDNEVSLTGGELIHLSLDVAEVKSINQLATDLSGTELDIIINNAGVSVPERFGEWSPAGFESGFRVNTIGPALVAQALVPLMRAGSRLINLSSGLGSIELNINPDTALDSYAMSKAALNMLTRRLAAKLRPGGIIAIAVDPGWVRTDMGGEEAPETVEKSVAGMAALIESLTLDHSGYFYSASGERKPW